MRSILVERSGTGFLRFLLTTESLMMNKKVAESLGLSAFLSTFATRKLLL